MAIQSLNNFNMKAWLDLESNSDITICTTINSQWYLNYGCKIERFNDGSFEIKNTMTNSDIYEDVDEKTYRLFVDKGWEHGAFQNCIDVYSARANKTLELIDRALLSNKYLVSERLHGTREKLINKINDYSCRLNKLS